MLYHTAALLLFQGSLGGTCNQVSKAVAFETIQQARCCKGQTADLWTCRQIPVLKY
jgi:hypothetical protein